MRSAGELKDFIQSDPKLSRIAEVAAGNSSNDPGHDLQHFMRVALWTLRLGEGALEEFEAIAAALLHDIVNVPKNSPQRKEASRFCAEAAREILKSLKIEQRKIDGICEAIRTHSFSRGETPKTLLAKCLQDADRLEALGAIGIMRCISTGTQMGADYFHSEDPWAQHRDLDDRRFSIDHFFTKLLQLPKTMATAAGRREAEKRADTLQAFIQALGEELGQTRT